MTNASSGQMSASASRHSGQLRRHLGKKLLLSIQSECNAQGVNIPWNNIAAIVGPTITGSAVSQHLAKLRIRMFPNSDLLAGC